jgi:hypothetical protein
MFRRATGFLLAPQLSATALEQQKRIEGMTFYKRYDALRGEKDRSRLATAEYDLLIDKLNEFAEFQDKYAVSKNELDRTKKIANFCGLEVTKPNRRPTAEHVKPKPKVATPQE